VNIVFDLDGTLADVSHRLHHINGEVQNFTAFEDMCGEDQPIMEMMLVFRALLLDGHHIEIWSGRKERNRRQTEVWLNNFHCVGYRRLRMRPETDDQPDQDLKMSWLHALPYEERPRVVFDDRQQVVNMWRINGIRCCQVAKGDY
jgi:phosphoglycolate phosphatase-like HAD superfamily hydrolase